MTLKTIRGEAVDLPHNAVMGSEFIDPDEFGYQRFLERKSQLTTMSGFDPIWIPDWLFPFQQSMTSWAIRKGRAALFEDCGLGKTPQFLVWSENVVRRTNGRVLVLSPLAVSFQTFEQSERFGIECFVSRDGALPLGKKIILTNYEKLHMFKADDFVGVVCDESAILKNFDGATCAAITEFMKKLQYRLLCTATAAPNDYIELGTSSEALGELGHMDMLMRFFKNDQNTIRPMVYRNKGNNFAQLEDKAKWRFKGHAEIPFWRYVCSWARACRRPSDVGFPDDGFNLPEFIERQHVVKADSLPNGMLFALPAVGLTEQRDERSRTISERCERAAELANGHESSVVWCHLNPEGDLLEKLLSDGVQISGRDCEEEKEEKLMAFSSGQIKRIVTKSRIAGWGMNWQHCHHTVSFPSHSFEQYYQSVRRFWRFGQLHPVTSEIVTTEGEMSVLENLQRKAKAADRMFSALVKHMNEAQRLDRSLTFTQKEEVPQWL
jgi:hypothetical protein